MFSICAPTVGIGRFPDRVATWRPLTARGTLVADIRTATTGIAHSTALTVRSVVLSVPFALVVGLALVALGAVVTTGPVTAGLWISDAIAASALLAAIVSTGAAIRRRRHNR